ncbi:hypothetical protein GJA_3150 [Janthinobacterium agaricidamnosum NBRC 102515 = DSM 9628]|uniref:Uncharacterized protein n=1 Tax=Janthinobacterium agaricidamnosum NBRC 102515 = DSM 9628 TaxID=1349767 RepID=W0V919_9BURK|nr:hypothetical protein GJA_3150 [Janthinobacterium agaricidamnosum NBRC 102515 = DSM 9628]
MEKAVDQEMGARKEESSLMLRYGLQAMRFNVCLKSKK